jgi:hypothetical protein
MAKFRIRTAGEPRSLTASTKARAERVAHLQRGKGHMKVCIDRRKPNGRYELVRCYGPLSPWKYSPWK